FFSSRRRHTRWPRDWSSDVCSSDLNIAVLQRSPEEENPLLRDPFFRRFFGAPQQSQPQVAAGSGVIVDAKNGYVITNAHVVKDRSEERRVGKECRSQRGGRV